MLNKALRHILIHFTKSKTARFYIIYSVIIYCVYIQEITALTPQRFAEIMAVKPTDYNLEEIRIVPSPAA